MNENSGYHPCPCRDCFEIAIGTEEDGAASFCHACESAGCERGEHECSVEPELEEENAHDREDFCRGT